MKTKQETFDIVASALLKQGKPSVTGDGYGCLYRSPNGCKCAAGWLIPDEDYIPEMDYSDNTSANVQEDVRKVLIEKGFDPEFVKLLQQIHDSAFDISRFNKFNWIIVWKNEMIKFAERNDLSTKVFEQ